MQTVDMASWDRREHFSFFSRVAHPHYCTGFDLDITSFHTYAKGRGISLYYGLIYASTAVMNGIEAFRYRIRGKDVVLHDELWPSFTDMKPDAELFHITQLRAEGSMADFCRAAKGLSLTQTVYFPEGKEAARDDLIYFSCLPWFSFTRLTNETDDNPDDSIPRLAWGKYREDGGRLLPPYSLEVNHRLIDGIHIGRFVNGLQGYLDACAR